MRVLTPSPAGADRIVPRRARAGDAEALAGILTAALADKYRPALGRRATRAVAAEVRHDVAAARSGGYFVVERDGALAGGAHLAVGDPAEGGFMRRLTRSVGWPTAARALVVLGLLGTGRELAGDAYIEELAVHPEARRRGVAAALLGALEDEARRAGMTRLTLWVTLDNGPARALYGRAGFREARRRCWLVGRLVFRAPGALYLEKPL